MLEQLHNRACDDGILEIGNSVKLNRQVYLNACVGGRIVLGNDVLVGSNSVLRASDHIIENSDKPISQQGSAGGEIIIEDDVWLASNVVVVSGVRVGKGSVAAAGAGLTRDVQPYTVVGGYRLSSLKTTEIENFKLLINLANISDYFQGSLS